MVLPGCRSCGIPNLKSASERAFYSAGCNIVLETRTRRGARKPITFLLYVIISKLSKLGADSSAFPPEFRAEEASGLESKPDTRKER